MDITKLLPEHHIILDIQDGSRENILKKLSQPLIDSNIITNSEIFIQDILFREEQMTTVVNQNIAFPHARTRVANRLGLVVGILGEGVKSKFSFNDDVRIFFLIAIPHISPASHLSLLQILAKYVKDKSRINRILKAKKSINIIKAINSFLK